MLPVFLAFLAGGGVLVVASLLFGGGDHDADHPGDGLDHDHDHDHDVAGDADHEAEIAHAETEVAHGQGSPADVAGFMPLLSLRFWTFAAAAFGLSGTLMSLFGVPDLVAAGVAAPLGAALGWLVAWLFRWLRTSRISSETGVAHLEGSEARVVLPVRPGGIGKITVLSQGTRLELVARSTDGVVLEPGTLVILAGVGRDGVADVTALATERQRARATEPSGGNHGPGPS